MNEVINIISELRSKGVQLSEKEGMLVCKAPKGVIDDEIRQFIVDNKPELIKCLQEENSLELTKIVNRPMNIPLSYEQERLWFLAELGQSDQYHVPGFLNINGRANAEVIKGAFEYLTQRHETLRTCFREIDGEPYQLILDSLDVPVETVKLHGKEEGSQEVTAATSKFVMEPFDLANGPLIRILIIELSDEKFILGYCLHHIISDGWSITILQKELGEVFRSIYNQTTPQLPQLQVQFADYAIWQKKLLTPEKLLEKIAHWKEHLAGHQDINIPLDFKRPDNLSGRGNREMITLNQAKSGWIKDYCKNRNITLFSLLLSMVYGLLNRYCQQNDICIGMPIANRNHQNLEQMIGFFANTIVNRVHLNDEVTLEDLITVSQKELLRSQDYQDVPFSKVVDAVQPPREASKTPIFQVLANYVSFVNHDVSLDKGKSKTVTYEYNSSKFDLNFTFSEGSGISINVSLEYSTDLFKASTIKRLLRHYEILIEHLIRDQSIKLSEIILETNAEKFAIDGFNESNQNEWKPALLHQKLKKSEIQFLDRIAVVDYQQEITYQQLIDQSNILASLIRKKGNFDFVGICFNRSCEMITAILATLKTGAAYVTFDPQYPDDRISHMLGESKVEVLITDQYFAEKTVFKNVEHVIVSNGWFTDDVEVDDISNEEINPSNPAYVIYTSGSTGWPKGVVQTHQTIDNIVYFQQKLWVQGDSVHKRVGQFASASFDVSVQEIFFSLINNHTLFITPAETKRSPEEYIKFVVDNRLNYVFLPTAYLDIFALESLDRNQSYPDLERIIVAGEALKITKFIRTFFKKNQNIRLENHYGPSETHVATKLTLDEDADNWDYTPSIGKPIPNLKVHILNKSMVKAPLGGIGEIYISGSGLASGYLNNRDLTSEKFIDNPFGVELLYKTGDLGRWLENGDIEFHGRADEQVKIRGYRVELGEVEKIILEHPDVATACVLVKEQAGFQKLIGYYAGDKKVPAEEVKVVLHKNLPNYMIPAVLVQVDEIPVTSNGKIDRRKLLAIEPLQVTTDGYLKPETALQIELAELWKALLGVNQVGLDDNFFELGGHSLLAVKLVSLLNKHKPDNNLKVLDILKFPTIKSLTNYLESDIANSVQSPYILQFVQPGATFIIPGMPGQSDGYHDMAVRLNKGNGGVYGLQMKGFLDENPLLTIEEMAAHNLKLIEEIIPEGNLDFYCHSYGGTVAYEMLRQIEPNRYCIKELIYLDSSPHSVARDMKAESAISLAHAIMWKYQIREEKLYKEIMRLVNEYSRDQWKNNITEYMDKNINGFDHTFFGKMWDVVETSMGIDYKMTDRLDYSLKMVIPNGSIGMVDERAWEPFYKEVDVYLTSGDHFSMIRKEYCNEWLEKLEKLTQKETDKMV